jgi:hypothetical protein
MSVPAPRGPTKGIVCVAMTGTPGATFDSLHERNG